jgi:hypothetical protein
MFLTRISTRLPPFRIRETRGKGGVKELPLQINADGLNPALARDIILSTIETYIVHSELSGNVLQLLRVSNADSQRTTASWEPPLGNLITPDAIRGERQRTNEKGPSGGRGLF